MKVSTLFYILGIALILAAGFGIQPAAGFAVFGGLFIGRLIGIAQTFEELDLWDKFPSQKQKRDDLP